MGDSLVVGCTRAQRAQRGTRVTWEASSPEDVVSGLSTGEGMGTRTVIEKQKNVRGVEGTDVERLKG